MKYRRVAQGSSVYNDSSFRWNGVVFHVYALVRSKTGNNLPAVPNTKFVKNVKRIPKEVEGDLSGENKVKAQEAADAEELWFIKVDGEGWDWRSKNGAKHVPTIHAIVQWLEPFKTSSKAHSSEAFYVEVTTNLLK